MVFRVSYSAVSGSLEPLLTSVGPPIWLAAPQIRFCVVCVTSSSAAIAVRFWQVALGFWLAGMMVTRASTGLTPTAWGPISGATLEPRVRVAWICAQQPVQDRSQALATKASMVSAS